MANTINRDLQKKTNQNVKSDENSYIDQFKNKNSKNNMNKNDLKIIPIGGTSSVTKNLYVYETTQDILIVDCGIGFTDEETPGIDIIIPDFKYVLDNREKVRGILITHGHYDHRNALKYLLQEHTFKVYATKFVKGFIEKDLSEIKELKTYKVNEFNPDSTLKIGNFTIHPYRMNHSIPDTLGFAIDTPQGRVFHNTDFKFDFTPVMDKPFDVKKAAKLASEQEPLLLLSDCLGSTKEGYVRSERDIQDIFEEILSKHIGSQVFITTTSTNVSRWQQAIDAGLKYNRKIVLSGRSIDNAVDVAMRLGYLKVPKNAVVKDQDARHLSHGEALYLIAGTYGQKESSLGKLISGDHHHLKLGNNAVVIFAADPMPSAIVAVDHMINELYRRGAEVYYSQIQGGLHVSGHGGRGDLTLLANIIKPKYFMPIGGEVKNRRAYTEMLSAQGIEKKRVLSVPEGQQIIFENRQVRMGKKLKLKQVYIEGNTVGNIGTRILNDRRQMNENGVLVISKVDDKIVLTSKGFLFERNNKELFRSVREYINKITNENKKLTNIILERKVARFIMRRTQIEPLVVAVNFSKQVGKNKSKRKQNNNSSKSRNDNASNKTTDYNQAIKAGQKGKSVKSISE